MDNEINILFDLITGISYIEVFTLSIRLFWVRLEWSLLYGFVLICWVQFVVSQQWVSRRGAPYLPYLTSSCVIVDTHTGIACTDVDEMISCDHSRIHVQICWRYESPPCGTLCFVDYELGPNLELGTDINFTEAVSPDIQGQRGTVNRRSSRTRV